MRTTTSPQTTRRGILGAGAALVPVIGLVGAACARRPVQEEAPAPRVTPPAGAARQVPRNRTLILGFEGGPVLVPENANPYIPNFRINQGIHQAMIESLWYLNYEDGKLIPWLAEDYQFNQNFSEVTIKLRRGVTWSDGKPFTARDVVFTINLLKENAPRLSYSADMQKWVTGITAPDDTTVRITLAEPYPRFIMEYFGVHIWGAVRILPEHIWKGQDPMTFTNFDLERGWPVFTGPYRLVKANQNEFVYDRRDDWWGAKSGFKPLPAPERLIFVEQGSQERRVALLQNNEVDGLPSIAAGPFETAMARNRNVIGWLKNKPWAWVDPCPGRLLFNCAKAPWDDPEIRWAINYAFNKAEYTRLSSEGTVGPEWLARFVFPRYRPLTAYLDKNTDLFQTYNTREYNPDKARQILERKGYRKGPDGVLVGPDGKRLTADLIWGSPAEGWLMPPINYLAENLKALGIDVALKTLSGAARQEAVDFGTYDLLPYHNCGGVVDPYLTFDNYHVRWWKPAGERLIGGQQNTPRWKSAKSEEFSRIVDQMRVTPPGDARLDPLVRQALELWLSELPNAPIAQQVRIVPYNTTYWTNFPTAENNYIHPPNWWMTTLLIIMNVKPAR